MSTRSGKKMFVGSRARPLRRADNLVAVCEPIVQQCGILNIPQPYRPPRPVTGIALLTFFISADTLSRYRQPMKMGCLGDNNGLDINPVLKLTREARLGFWNTKRPLEQQLDTGRNWRQLQGDRPQGCASVSQSTAPCSY
jgi:hypothetical protein